jgi:ribose-phosphate pyrophosphokinase
MRRRRPGLLRRRPRPRLHLVSGRSNPALAARIAESLGTHCSAVELETFANGETYCRYPESIRGADLFVVQSCSPPVNDHLVELLLLIHAARLASAHRITAVMPWFPYSRQDKKSRPREPISARLVAALLETAGVDRVVAMDLHAGQVQGFFDVPVDHVTALPLFADHFALAAREGQLVAVSPDLGRVKLARRLSSMLGADMAVVTKTRPVHDVAQVAEVIGDVRGKLAVIGDDMIVTGRTVLGACEALHEAGAREVRVFATHALFADGALERLAGSELAEIVVTDTVRLSRASTVPRLTVLSVADMLVETISSVFEDRSVSAIFGGLELF